MPKTHDHEASASAFVVHVIVQAKRRRAQINDGKIICVTLTARTNRSFVRLSRVHVSVCPSVCLSASVRAAVNVSLSNTPSDAQPLYHNARYSIKSHLQTDKLLIHLYGEIKNDKFINKIKFKPTEVRKNISS